MSAKAAIIKNTAKTELTIINRTSAAVSILWLLYHIYRSYALECWGWFLAEKHKGGVQMVRWVSTAGKNRAQCQERQDRPHLAWLGMARCVCPVIIVGFANIWQNRLWLRGVQGQNQPRFWDTLTCCRYRNSGHFLLLVRRIYVRL